MYIDFSPSLQFGQVGCPDWSTEASGTLHMIDTRAKSDGTQNNRYVQSTSTPCMYTCAE